MGFLVLAAAMAASQIPSASTMPTVHADYGVALKAAQQSGKPLLIVIEAPQDAKVAATATRSAKQEVDQLLSKYVVCKIDATTKYGQSVAAAFKADAIPFTAIISKDANRQLFRRAGLMPQDEMVATLAQYQHGVRPVSIRLETNSGSFNGGFSRGGRAGC